MAASRVTVTLQTIKLHVCLGVTTSNHLWYETRTVTTQKQVVEKTGHRERGKSEEEKGNNDKDTDG